MRSSTFPHTKLPAPHTLTVWWTVDTDSASHSMILSLLLSLRQLICNWCKRRLELTHKATECNHQLLHAHTNTRGCKNLASGNPCNITLRTASSNCWCVKTAILQKFDQFKKQNRQKQSDRQGVDLSDKRRSVGEHRQQFGGDTLIDVVRMFTAFARVVHESPESKNYRSTHLHTYTLNRSAFNLDQSTKLMFHLIVVSPDRCFTWSLFYLVNVFLTWKRSLCSLPPQIVYSIINRLQCGNIKLTANNNIHTAAIMSLDTEALGGVQGVL